MKRFALYLGLAAALVASCSIQEEDFKTPQQNDVIYYASFEQPAEDGTRVYANEDLLLRWTADDRVSIFGKITYNQQYMFLGETGDNSGGFSKVDGAEYVTGNPLSHTVSVYPYQASTKITEGEVLTVTLPAEQHYAENTFGLGANTMVSVSEDNVLQYKSVGGFLRLSLYGEGVTVSSITLKGNNGETLAGKATITMPMDGTPSVSLAEDATDAITIVCDVPVKLGATAEESVYFWFVLPPVTFSKGFTVTVSGNRGVYEKSTEKTLTIERNKVKKMSPIEVELSQPRNVIYYTSSDGEVITPYPEAFVTSILSNNYVNGFGTITFDGDVTSFGEYAFAGSANLTSISLPNSVSSLGSCAFRNCFKLTSVYLVEGVKSIGNEAFSGCSNLTSITLPDGLTSIGYLVFRACENLTSITLPESLTSMGFASFGDCTSLASIKLPGGLTRIENQTFDSCTSLASVYIPDSVTSIGGGAFSGCSSLTSISIPESVTSIEGGAFKGCTSLISVFIPDGVTSLESNPFSDCSSLVSFSGKFASADGLFLIDSESIIAAAPGGIGEVVTIPDGITSIAGSAFGGCSRMTDIIIPESVTSIGGGAFSRCSSLTSIIIPECVTSIGGFAFSSCSSLTSISIPAGVSSIGSNTFQNCSSLVSITLPDSVTSIWAQAFEGCSSLTNITLPEGLTSIEDNLFRNCSNLISIDIPSGVTSIGYDAFRGCTSLAHLSLPNVLTTIGRGSFWDCSSLISINIPSSVATIGDYAFRGCTSLVRITAFSATPPRGGSRMFDDTNNAPIYVPSTSVYDYKEALYWRNYAERIQSIIPEITIDGDFSDWEGIEGVSNGAYGMFKAASDSDNLYFYTYRTTDGRYSSIWGEAGYIYLGFDLDGNPNNGEVLNGNGPYDFLGFFFPYGGTAEEPGFIDRPGGWDLSWAPAVGFTLANMKCKGVANEKGAYIEYSIPRKDLPTIPNTPISITSWGNKDLSKVTLTCTL